MLFNIYGEQRESPVALCSMSHSQLAAGKKSSTPWLLKKGLEYKSDEELLRGWDCLDWRKGGSGEILSLSTTV